MELISTCDKNGIPMVHLYIKDKNIGYIRFLIDKKDKAVYLYHIFIKPEYRRQGYAKEAMNIFLAETNGFDIHLHIADYSECAKKFWDSFFEGKTVYALKNKNSYLVSNSQKKYCLPRYKRDETVEFCCNDCY